MDEELLPIIIEILIENTKNNKSISISNIEDICGYENSSIVKGVKLLLKIGLVKKTEDEYLIVKDIKAIHLAKSAQLGLDLNIFSSFFNITEKEKKIALQMASKVDKIKHLDVSIRKPLIQKRNYYINLEQDVVYDNLLTLLEISNHNLYEYIEMLSEKDAYLKLLLAIHKESENSLKNYNY